MYWNLYFIWVFMILLCYNLWFSDSRPDIACWDMTKSVAFTQFLLDSPKFLGYKICLWQCFQETIHSFIYLWLTLDTTFVLVLVPPMYWSTVWGNKNWGSLSEDWLEFLKWSVFIIKFSCYGKKCSFLQLLCMV